MKPFRGSFLLLFWALAFTAARAERLDPFDLLQCRAKGGTLVAATTTAEWLPRRTEIIQAMQEIVGKLPGDEKRCPLEVRIEEEVDCGSYVRRLITYSSEPGCRTPAYLCIPNAALASTTPIAPGVLCLHPTDNTAGFKVVVGLAGKQHRQYAAELAERGFVTIAPNYPLLAQYQPDLKALGYESGTMKAIWDNKRALDVLDTLPFVKHDAYGAIGHSLGGHNAIFTAVFDHRISVVVSSSGFDSFGDYYGGKPELWAHGKGWCQDRYMPKLAAYQNKLKDIPFDFPELLAALAPRDVFINAPLKDGNFKHDSVDRVVKAASAVYALHRAEDHLIVDHPDCEHDFPDAQREKAYALMKKVLR